MCDRAMHALAVEAVVGTAALALISSIGGRNGCPVPGARRDVGDGISFNSMIAVSSGHKSWAVTAIFRYGFCFARIIIIHDSL